MRGVPQYIVPSIERCLRYGDSGIQDERQDRPNDDTHLATIHLRRTPGVYVHSFAMASCGHRGHDGSHESEPLVRLLLSSLMASRIPCRSSTSCGCEPLSSRRIEAAFSQSATRASPQRMTAAAVPGHQRCREHLPPDLTAQCLTQVVRSGVIFPNISALLLTGKRSHSRACRASLLCASSRIVTRQRPLPARSGTTSELP